jgi:predicted nuclease with TOPRIM domain
LTQQAERIGELERRIAELSENMSRRELYMQTKEKKWAEVENYLQTLYDTNDALFYKM